jgi:hypothetical protein
MAAVLQQNNEAASEGGLPVDIRDIHLTQKAERSTSNRA